MEIDEAQLKLLVDSPGERLDVELKNWLDLNDNAHRALLAKAILALANHGGGVVLIGFTEQGPDTSAPADIKRAYKQDTINDIVDRFAEPPFHCSVYYVPRTADGVIHPVVVVPGGHRVPVRSRKGSAGNEIQPNLYYIRRPGPASEPPQSALEWDDLLNRCSRNRRDEITEALRDMLDGRAPKAAQEPDRVAQLEEWTAESLERWKTCIGNIPDNGKNAAIRMPHGYYTVSAHIEGTSLTLAEAIQVAQTASRIKYTGWSPFWWPTRDELRPYAYDGAVECCLGAGLQESTSDHADFWRIARDGRLFILRGYTEDGMRARGKQNVEPGTVLDLVQPTWRVGEILLYFARFAEGAGREHATVNISCKWTGLRHRHLVALSGDRGLHEDRMSRANECSTRITTPAERIKAGLPEIVRELVEPVYMMFDFFQPSAEFYASELARLQQGRF
jgi:hypothetical protein